MPLGTQPCAQPVFLPVCAPLNARSPDCEAKLPARVTRGRRGTTPIATSRRPAALQAPTGLRPASATAPSRPPASAWRPRPPRPACLAAWLASSSAGGLGKSRVREIAKDYGGVAGDNMGLLAGFAGVNGCRRVFYRLKELGIGVVGGYRGSYPRLYELMNGNMIREPCQSCT